jgi:RNA polymerase sigma factor (sigma-70 family)
MDLPSRDKGGAARKQPEPVQVSEASALEDRQVRWLLADLERYLGREFRWTTPQDREDLCQEAFAQLLAYLAAGHEVRNARGLLRTMAYRIALRRHASTRGREVLSDPSSQSLDQGTEAADPHRILLGRLDAAWLAEALDSLSPRERAAYRARYLEELDPHEASERIGVSRATYFRALQRATEKVAAATTPDDRFGARQTKLLRDYVDGTLEEAGLRRAERLIAADPYAAAEARRLRTLHRGAAVLIPPAAGATATGLLATVLEAARKLLGSGGAPASSAGSGAASGASGGLAVATVGGKAALSLCAVAVLGAGAVATVRGPSGDDHPRSDAVAAPTAADRPAPPLVDVVDPPVALGRGHARVAAARPGSNHGRGDPPAGNEPAGAESTSQALRDVTQEEFDPLAAPSPTTEPVAPAPTSYSTTDGGGSTSSSGGGSGAIAGEEWGP